MTSPRSLGEFDPFDPVYLADPYPRLKAIRESSPALHVERHDFYLLTRYDDVVSASRNHAVFSSTGGVGLEWRRRRMMPMYDPPEHTRLRRLVAGPFSHASIQQLASVVTPLAESVLDRALEGPVECMRDVAERFSLATLANILGIPTELQSSFRRWAEAIMDDLASNVPVSEAEEADAARPEFVEFLRQAITDRHERPGKTISRLVQANSEDRLTDKELLAFCVLLVVAGLEPVAGAMGNALHLLASHPEVWSSVLRGETSLETTLEEALRYDTSVQAFFRNTLAEVAIGGATIPKGAKVMLHFGSANRDAAKFPDADAFLPSRHPNPHIAFGVGVHHCLGAPLARLQLKVFFEGLCRRGVTPRLAGPEVRSDSLLFRRFETLPMRFDPA